MKIRNDDLKKNSLNGLAQKINDEGNKLLKKLADEQANSNSSRIAPLVAIGIIGTVVAAAGVASDTGIGIAGLLNKPTSVLGAGKTRKLKFKVNCEKWCLVRLTVGIQSIPMIIPPNLDIDVDLKVIIYNEGDRISESEVTYLEIGTNEQLMEFVQNYDTDATGKFGSIENVYLTHENVNILIDNSKSIPLILINADIGDIYDY